MFERWPSRCILVMAGAACLTASWFAGRKLDELATHGQFATAPHIETATHVTSGVAVQDAARIGSEPP